MRTSTSGQLRALDSIGGEFPTNIILSKPEIVHVLFMLFGHGAGLNTMVLHLQSKQRDIDSKGKLNPEISVYDAPCSVHAIRWGQLV